MNWSQRFTHAHYNHPQQRPALHPENFDFAVEGRQTVQRVWKTSDKYIISK